MADAPVSPGDPAPDFDLPATRDERVRLSDLRGKPVVVYFYPKDNTPGCTREGQAFRDLYPRFRELGAEVIGISRDSLKSHQRFADKHELPFPLAADPDEEACEAFGVLKEKAGGRRGVARSTFVIDADGALRHAHRQVKVDGHAEAVLEEVRALVR